jgi:hypothetical protein
MIEKEFLNEVYALCDKYGVMYFHQRDSRGTAGKGFPDLVLSGMGRTIFVEVKADEYSTFSPEQTQWKYRLTASGEVYRIFYYADLKSGVVENVLKKIAGWS